MIRSITRRAIWLVALIVSLESLHAQTIAKIKVSPEVSSAVESTNKMAKVKDSLNAINSAILDFNKSFGHAPLETTLKKLTSIQKQAADTLFNDTTDIHNLTPKIQFVTTLSATQLSQRQFTLDTIPWVNAETLAQIQAVNQLVTTFKKTASPALPEQIEQKISGNEALLHVAQAKKLDTIIAASLLKPLFDTALRLNLDTIAISQYVVVADTVTGAAAKSASSKCPKIDSIVSLKADKQEDGSVLFSFVNGSDNPLATFKIAQFNEPLFYDELSKAIFGLCTPSLSVADSTEGKALIAKFQKDKLYQTMLEKTYAAVNSQDLAGTLTIYKIAAVHTVKDYDILERQKSDSTTKKKSASSKKGTLQVASPPPKNADSANQAAPGTPTPVGAILPGLVVSYMEDNAAYLSQMAIIFGKKHESRRPDSPIKFTVYGIKIHFQDGFIENIMVIGKMAGDNHELKFENSLPIPFTTKREYSQFRKINLFEKTRYADSDYNLNLAEVIAYTEEYALNNKDYSPENQIYENDKVTDSVTQVNLYKEQTSQILQANVFSDLKGLNSSNPNGLVQLELSKKFNLWSNREPIGRYLNIGYFNYVTPFGSLNKIESNQKYLILNTNDSIANPNNVRQPLTYTSTVNLLAHQEFKVGFDLSVILLDVPSWKSDVNLGMSAYFGSTPIQDTLRSDTSITTLPPRYLPAKTNNVITYDANTFQWGPYISWQIFPNPKYGVIVTYRAFAFKSLNSRFSQVRDSANYTNFILANVNNPAQFAKYSYAPSLYTKCISSTEFFAYYTPSANSQLFFRYRFNSDLTYSKEHFRQIQLGVTTYLTTTKESKNGKSSTNTSTNTSN